jgi:hypothetical protein
MTADKTYLLVVAASPVGSDCADHVKLAIARVTRPLVSRWEDYSGVVRSLARGDSSVAHMTAGCTVDFYTTNPIPKDHPDYAEVAKVLEDGHGWLLLPDNVNFTGTPEPIRTSVEHVTVWARDLVFAATAKYGDDRYESTFVDAGELFHEVMSRN